MCLPDDWNPSLLNISSLREIRMAWHNLFLLGQLIPFETTGLFDHVERCIWLQITSLVPPRPEAFPLVRYQTSKLCEQELT
jgi:hypothetical protein